jgi:DNA-binding MarR family transcriptional regulator
MNAQRPTGPSSLPTRNPWALLDADGSGLGLEDFLGFHVVRLAHAVQRISSRAYLDPHELTSPDWRVLGFVHRYGPVQFSEITNRTSLDKAQVSRTVRSLRARGLLSAEGDAAHVQRVVLSVTSTGQRLYARILPQAARTQVQLLEVLDPDERTVLWRALHKLHQHATDPDGDWPAPATALRKPRKKTT